MIYIVNVNDEFKNRIPSLISIMNGKNLIFSLIQENRDLEISFDIENEIIYDNSDYLSGIVDIEKVIIEIDDNTDIIPSSYRMKVDEYDFSKILKDLEKYEYNNIFILIDKNLKLINLNEKDIIYSSTSDNVLKNTKTIITDTKKLYSDNYQIYGYLNSDSEDLSVLAHNLENNYILENKKKSIYEKIKEIFK